MAERQVIVSRSPLGTCCPNDGNPNPIISDATTSEPNLGLSGPESVNSGGMCSLSNIFSDTFQPVSNSTSLLLLWMSSSNTFVDNYKGFSSRIFGLCA